MVRLTAESQAGQKYSCPFWRGQKTEDRGQKTGDRRKKNKDRRKKNKDRNKKSEYGIMVIKLSRLFRTKVGAYNHGS
jgi:hypothetical protein